MVEAKKDWVQWFRHISKSQKKSLNEELNYTKEVLSFFPDLQEKRVLDVGCGNGDFLISCCLLGAKETVGIDFVAEVVKGALKNVNNSGFEKKINVVQADALKIPFPDNSFDVVMSFGLLEHFEKQSELIFEKKRVLKKNGFLIVLVPNFFSIPRQFFGIARRIFQPENVIFEKPLTSWLLKKELEKAGLRKIEIKGIYYFPYQAIIKEAITVSKSLMVFNLLNNSFMKHFAWFLIMKVRK
jgi:2-polyprenyl-3-methyl-5-hydroxy-6-metoxy-1,4-benzoquinol methylase